MRTLKRQRFQNRLIDNLRVLCNLQRSHVAVGNNSPEVDLLIFTISTLKFIMSYWLVSNRIGVEKLILRG